MSRESHDYFPSCKVKLGIRFDELSRRVFTGKIPPRPLKVLSGIKDPRAPLKVIADPEAPAGSTRLLLDFDTGKPTYPSLTRAFTSLGPQRQVKSGDGLTHVLGGIIPREATWNQNGIRMADTLSVTLRFIDCPIDPRTVRSAWVLFYLGTVSAEEYAQGQQGARRQSGESMLMIPETFIDDQGRLRTNLRFQGFIDKWTNDWNDSGEPIIRLECRDNTQLLIDTEAPAKLRIEAKAAINRSIANYLSHFPQFAGLTVEYRPNKVAEKDIPRLQEAYSTSAFRPMLGPAPSLAAAAPTGLSVWDFLTDVVGSLGHNIRVENNNILIQRTRTMYSSDAASVNRPDDPFQGRDGRPFRRFFYGRNLIDLKLERSFVRTAPTNIEVRSYDADKKLPIVGRFPTDVRGGVQTSIPGDGGAEEKWLVYKVHGIKNPLTLRVIAQNIYEQLGRQELTVKFKTRNLASFGAKDTQLDPDILDMRAPDSFELLVARTSDDVDTDELERLMSNTLTNIEKFLTVQKDRSQAFMESLGFDPEFSKAYANVYNDLGLQTNYRMKTGAISWNVDQGISIDIEGINYIEVRADSLNIPGSKEPTK